MRIATLGSGLAGRALGLGCAREGHEVWMGTRDPDSDHVREWLGQVGGPARATSYREAAAWCELAFFVPTWSHAEDVVVMSGTGNLADKIVVDVTNPLGLRPDGGLGMAEPLHDGAGAHVQRLLPRSRVVKAFNTVGYRLMAHPDLPCGPPTMPICGDDPDAKAVVAQLVRSLGWEPFDFGSIAFSGFLEAMAVVWIEYGRCGGAREHAFRMLAR